jgi:hypothetical protein
LILFIILLAFGGLSVVLSAGLLAVMLAGEYMEK